MRQADTFQCLCEAGRGGRLCESALLDIMVADQAVHEDHVRGNHVVFDGRRVLRIMNRGERKVSSEKTNEFEFEIRTVDENAVIVSTSDWQKAFGRDMFEICLVDGRVEVRVKIGSDVGLGVSRRRIDRGEWRKVWVGRRERKVIVKIVGEESFSFSIGDGDKTKRKRNSLRSTGYIWLGRLGGGELLLLIKSLYSRWKRYWYSCRYAQGHA